MAFLLNTSMRIYPLVANSPFSLALRPQLVSPLEIKGACRAIIKSKTSRIPRGKASAGLCWTMHELYEERSAT